MATIYRFEDLKEKMVLRQQNRFMQEEAAEISIQLQRLNNYDPTKSHPEMVEDLINASELLAIEYNKLRREVLTLKLEKLHDQQTARQYPFADWDSFDGNGFDPAGGGR